MESSMSRIALVLLLVAAGLAGCVGEPTESPDAIRETGPQADAPLPIETGECIRGDGGAKPPEGEEVVGLQPVEMTFGGSLRHPLTRVLLVPPTHGDLGSPGNTSRSGPAYLQATLEGILSWELAIEEFVAEYPEFGHLDNVTVQIEIFDGEVPATAGYDVIVGYAESGGGAFRGVAIFGGVDTQRPIDQAGLGDLVHYANRYILLSLFSNSPRAGQEIPDYPETHEVRGVTMHEFAHTWGLGHSTTWTPGCGDDLMNSPYAHVYGDGDPLGDGGERSPEMCISSLDLYGLAHLYRWLPNGTWQTSQSSVSLPDSMVYKEYCVQDEAERAAEAWMDAQRFS